jgi:Tol biopolymer transport system component
VKLSPGTALGPYEIAELLDAGGMGEVYRARDTRLGRDVALKIIQDVGSAQAVMLERFELEGRLAGRLNHPNIAAVYDVGSHDGAPYLVMELLEGETLAASLGRAMLPPKRILDLALQIANGLAAAHAKGVIHRDLKPSNIFLTRDGQVKIVDFGLAEPLVPSPATDNTSAATSPVLTSSDRVMGTASYMSPEQVRGEAADQRSDIFSFGVVLYEMLTGRRAFQAPTSIETLNAILNAEPPGMGDASLTLPPGLESLLQHCLEKAPDARFQSARDLAFHIASLVDDRISGLHAPRRGKAAPRLPTAVGRLALVALLLLAAATASYYAGEHAGRGQIPSYQPLTFRRGVVLSARFDPDRQIVAYGAAWDGQPFRLYTTRPGSPESTRLDLPDADVLSISRSGEMALSLGRHFTLGLETRGTLARVPLSGGAPREILADVESADWDPGGSNLAVVHVVHDRYRLEFPIGTVLYETGGWLSHVRFSPDGGSVGFIEHAVRSDDRGDVCVIDRDGQGRRSLSPDWSSANGLAWRGDGREIWFTASHVGPRSALYGVDLSGNRRLITRAPGRLRLEDVRGTSALLTEDRFRLQLAFRDESGAERDLSWLDGATLTDLSDDGRTVLFSEQGAGAGANSGSVYLRRTDGSPAVRLGEGWIGILSPDGAWAASVVLTTPPSLILLPTGAGQPRTVESGGIVHFEALSWFPDGQRLLFAGEESGRGVRLYVQEIAQGKPQPISGEGFRIAYGSRPVSPDGRQIAALDHDGRIVLYSVERQDPQAVPGLDAGDIPVRWGAEGRSLYVSRRGTLPAKIWRVDLARGSKTLAAELAPFDRAGVMNLIVAQATPEGRTFAYSYSRTFSDLALVEGLR